MTYDVSDAEKVEAEKALMCFGYTMKLLNIASNHLNIMKTPFENNTEINPDEIMKVRAALRRFRDKSVENFNDFKKSAFKCVQIMQNFASDTQTIKIMKSFIYSIDDLEFKVNKFVDLFDDLTDKKFTADTVTIINDIHKQCEEIEELVEERIKNHIQNNILASSWVDSLSNELHMKIEEKTPLVIDLYNKREDQLNEIIREKSNIGS